MKNSEKGVTLVALVTTIIVLIIIAGVSIGNINKGTIKETKEKTAEAQKESIIEKIEADIYNEKIKKGRDLNNSEAKAILEKYGTITENDGKETLKVIDDSDENTEILIDVDTIIGYQK